MLTFFSKIFVFYFLKIDSIRQFYRILTQFCDVIFFYFFYIFYRASLSNV